MTTCRACGRTECGAGNLCALCGAYDAAMGGGLSPRGERFPEIDGTDARSAALGRQPRDAAAPTGAADGDHGDDTPEPRPGDAVVTLRLTVHDAACLLMVLMGHETQGRDEEMGRVMAEINEAVTDEEFEREVAAG